MNEYHKIPTIFKRDSNTNYKSLVEGKYATPELEYLSRNQWIFTEKIDGTNIRILTTETDIEFRGKTNSANIPTFLHERLKEMFPHTKVMELFTCESPIEVCLYGEGYGAKIQKGGGNYIPDGQSFILFDVKVGRWWLKREDVEDIATKLNIKVVPIIGEGTLPDLVSKVRTGFRSEWGSFMAEGIVAKPKCELFARNGKRIITKLKHKDFEQNMTRGKHE